MAEAGEPHERSIRELREWMSRRIYPSRGRPTDTSWRISRLVPMRRETWDSLNETAVAISAKERRISPAQVAAVLLEYAIEELQAGRLRDRHAKTARRLVDRVAAAGGDRPVLLARHLTATPVVPRREAGSRSCEHVAALHGDFTRRWGPAELSLSVRRGRLTVQLAGLERAIEGSVIVAVEEGNEVRVVALAEKDPLSGELAASIPWSGDAVPIDIGIGVLPRVDS